jgi:hypothetical protein
MPAVDEMPILAVDVDGVISLFGFDSPPPAAMVRWELIDGTPHCLLIAAGERLNRLAGRFELVWATGWQDRANDRLSHVIGVGPLPVVEFDLPGAAQGAGGAAPGGSGGGGAGGGSVAGHWKLDSLERFAGRRALAWIDDSLEPSCFEWAERREESGAPTLLVPTEPGIGIEEAHVGALESWADDLRIALPR